MDIVFPNIGLSIDVIVWSIPVQFSIEQPERANVETPTKPVWDVCHLHVIEPLMGDAHLLLILLEPPLSRPH